jgi:hypothetical protein
MVKLELAHIDDLGGIEAGSRACWDEETYLFKLKGVCVCVCVVYFALSVSCDCP